MPIRVAVVMEIPTPYRNPIFQLLAQQKEIQIDFFFLSRTQKDRHWEAASFDQLNAAYLPGTQICFPGYHTIHLNQGVRKTLIDPKYDVYVLGGYAQTALAQVLSFCWRSKTPYVLLTESHLTKKRNWFVRLLKDRYVRKVYENSAANLVMGTGAKEYVEHYGADGSKIFRFPNTVDGPSYTNRIQKLRQAKNDLKTRLKITSDPVILFVGTLNRRKGVDLLIRAFDSVVGQYPHASLVMVGSGTLDTFLRKYSEKPGLVGKVFFPGFIQPLKLEEFYAIADIFVLPSLEEPFGAVICEAMAAELPVIVSRAVGAAKDFVIDKKTGVIVEAGNVQALTDALQKLVADPRARTEMGSRAVHQMDQWSHRILANNFLEAIRVAAKTKPL